MPVEKTTSPIVSPTAPKGRPAKVRPSSRTRTATGGSSSVGRGGCWVSVTGGDSVLGRGTAPQEGGADGTREGAPVVRVVAGERGRRAGVDGDGRGRVDEDEVGRGAYLEGLTKAKAAGMSEDDQKLWESEVQDLTDAHIAKVDAFLATKQEEIMQV
mgnify:CR=1 FL=1